MTTEAYELAEKFLGRSKSATAVLTFGAFGTQFAHLRRSPRGIIQCRIWRKASGEWTKWRKLQPGEILRLATAEDRARFKPDYGLAWERE